MNSINNFLTQRRRPLLWAGGLLSFYAVLGFLFVPWVVERQLIGTLQQRLGASTSIEAIRFNPFTFTASVDVLEVQAADSTPLLNLARLYLNFDPSRLLLLKARIAEITIDTPQLHYIRYSPTDDTITRLAQQWVATAEPEETVEGESTDEGLFPLEIGQFQYLNGSIEYRDEVPQTDFATTLGPLNIDIASVSTLDNAEPGIKDLVMQIEQDATLTWNSNFKIAPVEFTGHLALNNFSLTTPYRYFQDTLPFELRSGRLAVDFDYLFKLDTTGPHLEISNVAVQLSEVDAVEKGSATAFLAGGTLALENGNFLYPEMRAQASALRLDGINVALLRNPQGIVNLQAMLASFSGDDTGSPPSAEPGTPLQLDLDEFTVANTAVNFLDQTTATPAAFTVQVQAGLQNFTLTPGSALPFNIVLAFDAGGTLETMGTVQLFPEVDVDAMVELADLALLPVQPYLNEFAQVTLESGNLALAAHLRTNATEALAYQGEMTLSNLQLLDTQRAETLFSLETLQADNVDFSLTGRRLDISELIVDVFYSRVLIDENGITNIGEAFTSAKSGVAAEGSSIPVAEAAASDELVNEPAIPPEEAVADTAPFAISLGRMQINNASSDFTDRSLPIVFDTKMAALNGEVSGFSSASSQAMMLTLEGQVDEYGLVEIAGAVNPLDIEQQTEIELVFTNLALPAMTPYVIKFAGREIAEGKADVTLVYAIEDSALDASNSLVLRDLRLGPRVDYPDAMDLPLDLAVALLKNRDGIIDLNIPITGNVNDPQFSFGPIIRQAIFNVLGNIVTAPFRLLGNLIGGDAEEIDSIRFRPGRSDLAPPEQEKLQQLQGALIERPQLALKIPAPYVAEEDTRSLQISAVDARMEEQLAQDNSQEQLPERRLAVLENLYTAVLLTPALEELRLQFTPAADPEADEDRDDDAKPVFDSLAYSADLRDRLIAAEPVTEQMLQDLARERQATVTAFLQASGEITTARLQVQDVATVGMEDGWLDAMFDVGVIE